MSRQTKGYEQRDKLVRATSLHWFHWMIVVASLVLTVVAWYFSKQQIKEKVNGQFEREAAQVIQLVKEAMTLYEQTLWAAVALYDASEDVGYAAWKRYANSIRIDEKFVGINGIGVVHHVLKDNLGAYLAQQRETRPGFALHPESDRVEHWPITYVEPEEGNLKAIGLDLCFEVNRCNAVRNARDTGAAQLTGPIALVQDSRKTPGYLFVAPFYRDSQKPKTLEERRNQIEGVISAPFMMSKLMKGTLDRSNRYVGIQISDSGYSLYDDKEQGVSSDADADPLFSKREYVELYGRTWTFNIWSTMFFREASSNNQPYLILFGGILVDMMLLGMFLFLSRANRRALSYVDLVTDELQSEKLQLVQTIDDLEVARRKADVANVAKSEFLANMSHELRTPLNSILLLSQVLGQNSGGNLSPAQAECAEVIGTSSRHLNTLIDDILDLAKVEAGKMELDLSTCTAESMVKDLSGVFSEQAAQLGLQFKTQISNDFPQRFRSDYKRLHQILRNLLSNAFKFTHSGSVSLRFERAGPDLILHQANTASGNFLAISVQDTGIGISPEVQQDIFEEFVQADGSISRRYEGTGLGLAIARRMSTLLGGEMALSSDRGKGSTFTLFIPETMNDKRSVYGS